MEATHATLTFTRNSAVLIGKSTHAATTHAWWCTPKSTRWTECQRCPTILSFCIIHTCGVYCKGSDGFVTTSKPRGSRLWIVCEVNGPSWADMIKYNHSCYNDADGLVLNSEVEGCFFTLIREINIHRLIHFVSSCIIRWYPLYLSVISDIPC